jgi:hypothetical protein
MEFLASLGFLMFGKGSEMLLQNGGGAAYGRISLGFVFLHRQFLPNTSLLDSRQGQNTTLDALGVPQKERDDGCGPRIQLAICLGWRKIPLWWKNTTTR